MKLYLIRHAQSLRNVGQEHDRLSETGIEQAKRLGLFLKDNHIDYIYCSQKGRTKETLSYINKYIKAPTTFTEKIQEQNTGIFEEKSDKEFFYHMMALKLKVKEYAEYKPEGNGENLFEVEKRAQEFLNIIKEKHKFNDHILIVSHATFLKFLIIRLLKLHIKEAQYFNIHNASLSTFELDKKFNVKEYLVDDYIHLLKYSSYPRETVEKI